MIFAIDPGQSQSGWVMLDGKVIEASGIDDNDTMLNMIADASSMNDTMLAIETMQANYAATVGASVIDTLIWVGRFQQRWHNPNEVRLISRQAVKSYVCGNVKANDAGVRQALIDLLGPPGRKKATGPTHGITSHAWSALAVAVTAANLKG